MFQRLEVIDAAVASSAIDLVGIGTSVHIYVGTSADGLCTIATAIDAGCVSVLYGLVNGCLYVDVGIEGDAAVVVAAIDGIVHQSIFALVID